MQLGQLEPTEKPMINLVLDKLDESKSGLIPKRELKQAVRQVAEDNDLELDNATLNQLVDSGYASGEDGAKARQLSR